eukprot:jgi/Mesvir1/24035/Mv10773-RA.1
MKCGTVSHQCREMALLWLLFLLSGVSFCTADNHQEEVDLLQRLLLVQQLKIKAADILRQHGVDPSAIEAAMSDANRSPAHDPGRDGGGLSSPRPARAVAYPANDEKSHPFELVEAEDASHPPPQALLGSAGAATSAFEKAETAAPATTGHELLLQTARKAVIDARGFGAAPALKGRRGKRGRRSDRAAALPSVASRHKDKMKAADTLALEDTVPNHVSLLAPSPFTEAHSSTGADQPAPIINPAHVQSPWWIGHHGPPAGTPAHAPAPVPAGYGKGSAPQGPAQVSHSQSDVQMLTQLLRAALAHIEGGPVPSGDASTAPHAGVLPGAGAVREPLEDEVSKLSPATRARHPGGEASSTRLVASEKCRLFVPTDATPPHAGPPFPSQVGVPQTCRLVTTCGQDAYQPLHLAPVTTTPRQWHDVRGRRLMGREGDAVGEDRHGGGRQTYWGQGGEDIYSSGGLPEHHDRANESDGIVRGFDVGDTFGRVGEYDSSGGMGRVGDVDLPRRQQWRRRRRRRRLLGSPDVSSSRGQALPVFQPPDSPDKPNHAKLVARLLELLRPVPATSCVVHGVACGSKGARLGLAHLSGDGALGSCAVVGSSRSLLRRTYGQEIDAHDTVVRVGIPASSDDFDSFTGTKTAAVMLTHLDENETPSASSAADRSRHNNGLFATMSAHRSRSAAPALMTRDGVQEDPSAHAHVHRPAFFLYASSQKERRPLGMMQDLGRAVPFASLESLSVAGQRVAAAVFARLLEFSAPKVKPGKLVPSETFQLVIALLHSQLCNRVDLYGFARVPMGGHYWDGPFLVEDVAAFDQGAGGGSGAGAKGKDGVGAEYVAEHVFTGALEYFVYELAMANGLLCLHDF